MEPGAFEIRVLGPVTILRDGEPLRLPQSKKTRALLAYLALCRREHRRDRLCSMFWDVADDPKGALRWSLSKIRGLVNDPELSRLIADRKVVELAVDEDAVDLLRVRRMLKGDVQARPTDDLVGLANQFGGELLEGLDLTDFHEFTGWCAAEREDARSLHVKVLRTLVDRFEDAPEAALVHARELVRIDPLSEEERARLVRLLSRAGHRSEAEAQYESGRRLLKELGQREVGALREAWSEARAGVPSEPPVVEAPAPVQKALPEKAQREAAEPLVGREGEREALLDVFRSASESGSLRGLLLTGEAGVGKTRLLAELLREAGDAGSQIFRGAAFEAEMGRPYGPWIDALRQLPKGIVTTDTRLGLSLLLPELESDEDVEATRDHLFGAVVDLIGARARSDAPAVLLFDDVHWSDEATAELLHYVARMCRHRPVMLVLAARDGELVDCEPMMRVLRSFRRDRFLTEIELAPLDQSATEELLAEIDSEADPAEVFAQGGGNPLFTLELVRSGADLSLSLKGLVEGRLSQLPPEAADVLRWGAVLGPSFESDRIAKLVALDIDPLVDALSCLERHALLASDETGRRYTFPHDLVRRVIYDEVSAPRRRLMHMRAAHVLGDLADPDGRVAVEIAHHASLAGEASVAARACVVAGQRCLRVFANAEAWGHARRGLRYADSLEDPARLELKLELMRVNVQSRRPADPTQTAGEIERLAEQALNAGLSTHARLGFNMVSYLRWEEGDVAAARQLSLRAEVASRGGADHERILGTAEAARCLVMLEHRLPEAEALLLEARAVVARSGESSFSVADGMGLLRFHRGELAGAAEMFQEARSLARLAGNRIGEFSALEHLVWVELTRGAFDEGRAQAEELREIGAKLREGSEEPVSRALFEVCRYAMGESDAKVPLDAALGRLREVDAKQRLGFSLLQAALVEMRSGETGAAAARAEEALELGEVLERPSETALARCVLFAAARAAGDGESAAEHSKALGAVSGYAAYVRAAAEWLLADEEGRDGQGPGRATIR